MWLISNVSILLHLEFLKEKTEKENNTIRGKVWSGLDQEGPLEWMGLF